MVIASSDSGRGRSTGRSHCEDAVRPGFLAAIRLTPPIAAINALLVSNWRINARRVAPSAIRVAISRWRPEARASSRFATLAQAISNTRPTAPARISSTGRTSPIAVSASGVGVPDLVHLDALRMLAADRFRHRGELRIDGLDRHARLQTGRDSQVSCV